MPRRTLADVKQRAEQTDPVFMCMLTSLKIFIFSIAAIAIMMPWPAAARELKLLCHVEGHDHAGHTYVHDEIYIIDFDKRTIAGTGIPVYFTEDMIWFRDSVLGEVRINRLTGRIEEGSTDSEISYSGECRAAPKQKF